MFFEDVLPLRLPESSSEKLRPIAENSGFVGDMKSKSSQKITGPIPNYPTAWLPTARVAHAWEAMLKETPFD
jgi:hypothetical protein